MHFPRRMTTFVGDSVFPSRNWRNKKIRIVVYARVGNWVVWGKEQSSALIARKKHGGRKRKKDEASIDQQPPLSDTQGCFRLSSSVVGTGFAKNKKVVFHFFTPAVGVIGKSTSIP